MHLLLTLVLLPALRLAEPAEKPADDWAPPADVSFRRADILSEGTRMAAEVFAPKDSEGKKLPTIVMSHGWGGTAEALRPDAVAFARAGYLVVAFDYRGWGNSDSRVVLTKPAPPRDGKELTFTAEVRRVREVVDPIDQTTDVMNAIHWTVGEKQCDPARLGLWGSSYSGGHVVYVAAREPRVKALVSQVAAFDSRWVINAPVMRAQTYRQATARTQGKLGYPEPGAKVIGNLTGAPIMEKLAGYAPIEDVGRSKAAMLFLLAEKEELFDNKENGILAHKLAKGPKKLVIVPGIQHYGIYREARGRAQKEAIAWFDEHLKKAAREGSETGKTERGSPEKGKPSVKEDLDLEAFGQKLKAAVRDGEMSEEEAMTLYKQKATGLKGKPGAGGKRVGGPSTFYSVVIGRLKEKDIELGEFTLDVDHVTSIYGDRRLKDTIIGKTVKVVGVSGPWLDRLLLIKPGETLKVRSGTLQGATLSLSPKATVLERAVPFDPEVYPIPPKEFRGFRGIVTGKIISKSDQGYELTLKVETVEETFEGNAASKPSRIEGRLVDLRGFYDTRFRKTFDDLRLGDTIRVGAVHTDPTIDPLDVTRVLDKAGK